MWTRGELKERAKAALYRNYWKIVLVSVLLLLLGCGTGGGRFTAKRVNTESRQETDGKTGFIRIGERLGERSSTVQIVGGEEGGTEVRVNGFGMLVGMIAGIVFICIFVVIIALILVVDIFLINPFSVGGSRFMVKSVEDVAQVKEIGYGFDHCYKNIVKVLFFRDLYVFLWSLLLIVPGIVKMYQYYMVPYILTEYPDMEYKAALQLSSDMMKGNKWKTFVLGLSFILWDFFGALTFGILEILYVQPYRQLTYAALYCKLRDTSVINRREPVYGTTRQW